jgi:hypothetical protein
MRSGKFRFAGEQSAAGTKQMASALHTADFAKLSKTFFARVESKYKILNPIQEINHIASCVAFTSNSLRGRLTAKWAI